MTGSLMSTWLLLALIVLAKHILRMAFPLASEESFATSAASVALVRFPLSAHARSVICNRSVPDVAAAHSWFGVPKLLGIAISTT